MISEDIIKRIKRYLFDEPSIDDIKKALRRIENSHDAYTLERKNVERTIDVDEGKLFDVPIKDAITYLKTFDENHILEQRWTGYEDNDFVVVHDDVENDSEYADRISRLVSKKLDKIKKEAEEVERKKQQIAKLEEELRNLRKDL